MIDREEIQRQALALWERRADPRARGQLVLLALPYVRALAQRVMRSMRLHPSQETLDDLVAEACLKILTAAVDSYDPAHGSRWTTYCHQPALWAMNRWAKRFRSVISEPPKSRDVSIFNERLDLDDPEDPLTPVVERLRGSVEAPGVFADEDRARLYAAIAALDERERAVIEARLEGKTLIEVGAVTENTYHPESGGLSRERIRQIERDAVWRLRRLLKASE